MLGGARELAASHMRDSCRIERVTRGELGNNGRHAETRTLVWSGPCQFKTGSAQVDEREQAARSASALSHTLRIPASVTEAIGPDLVVTVTGNGRTLTARIVGEQYRTYGATRRFETEVIEWHAST